MGSTVHPMQPDMCSSPLKRQPCLLVQCQLHSWDTMVKVRSQMDWCLISRVLTLAKWIPLPPMTPSLTSTIWSIYSGMILPMSNSMAWSRLRMGNLSSVESPFPSLRSEILPTSNGVMLVLHMLWSPLAPLPPWRRLEFSWRVKPRGSTFCPFCSCSHVCD